MITLHSCGINDHVYYRGTNVRLLCDLWTDDRSDIVVGGGGGVSIFYFL